jgi:hypothetical protein
VGSVTVARAPEEYRCASLPPTARQSTLALSTGVAGTSRTLVVSDSSGLRSLGVPVCPVAPVTSQCSARAILPYIQTVAAIPRACRSSQSYHTITLHYSSSSTTATPANITAPSATDTSRHTSHHTPPLPWPSTVLACVVAQELLHHRHTGRPAA